jgi:hypothetical protein
VSWGIYDYLLLRAWALLDYVEVSVPRPRRDGP